MMQVPIRTAVRNTLISLGKYISRVGKNTLFLLTANAINSGLFFILLIFIGRLLGPQGFGEYSFAMVAAGFAVAFVELGLDTLAIRNISRHKENASGYLSMILKIKFVLAAIVFSFLFVMLSLSGMQPDAAFAVYALFIYAFLRTLTNSLKAVFRAFEKMHYEAALSLNGIVVVALGVFFMAAGFGLKGLVAAFVVGSITELISCIYLFTRKFAMPEQATQQPAWLDILRNAFPFAIVSILLAAYFSTGIFLLGLLDGAKSVGLYSAAYRILFAALAIITPLSDSLFPAFSKNHPSSPEKINALLNNSLKLILAVTLPISIAFMVLSEKITLALYGADFLPTSAVFLTLGFFPVILSVNMVLLGVMHSINRQNTNVLNLLVVVAANILANFVFIKDFGFIGAAYALMLSQTMFFLLTAYTLSKAHSNVFRLVWQLKTIFAINLLFGICLLLIKSMPLPVIAGISVALYLALLLFSGVDAFQLVLSSKLAD